MGAAIRAAVSRGVTRLITSPARRDLRRLLHGAPRMAGRPAAIDYFHQADDPSSHLAAQMLGPLRRRYGVAVRCWLVPPPGEAAAHGRDDQTTAAPADEGWREVAEANRMALFDAGPWGRRPSA